MKESSVILYGNGFCTVLYWNKENVSNLDMTGRIYKRNEKVGHEKLVVKASKVLSKLLDELFWKFDRIQPLCLGSHFFHFIHLSFSSKKVLEINLHFVRRTCNIFSYFWVRLDEFNYSFYFVQNPLWNPKICGSIWRICKYVIQTAS